MKQKKNTVLSTIGEIDGRLDRVIDAISDCYHFIYKN